MPCLGARPQLEILVFSGADGWEVISCTNLQIYLGSSTSFRRHLDGILVQGADAKCVMEAAKAVVEESRSSIATAHTEFSAVTVVG